MRFWKHVFAMLETHAYRFCLGCWQTPVNALTELMERESQGCKLLIRGLKRLFFLFCVFLWLFCVFCFPPLKIYNCRVQLLVCEFDLTVMLPNDKTFYITLLRAFPKWHSNTGLPWSNICFLERNLKLKYLKVVNFNLAILTLIWNTLGS